LIERRLPVGIADNEARAGLLDGPRRREATRRGHGPLIAPEPFKTNVVDKRNNPASPSPAVEANGVYVFFPDYGLIAYDETGTTRWTMPLGPFNNIYGMGAAPVIVGDLLVLACDQSLGSFIMAVNKRTGRVQWKTDRPEAKSGQIGRASCRERV
jgi:outer membrane protein assembly factor BamB